MRTYEILLRPFEAPLAAAQTFIEEAEHYWVAITSLTQQLLPTMEDWAYVETWPHHEPIGGTILYVLKDGSSGSISFMEQFPQSPEANAPDVDATITSIESFLGIRADWKPSE
jgi:hypothetical protein